MGPNAIGYNPNGKGTPISWLPHSLIYESNYTIMKSELTNKLIAKEYKASSKRMGLAARNLRKAERTLKLADVWLDVKQEEQIDHACEAYLNAQAFFQDQLHGMDCTMEQI